ncbi:MAG: hypothetical protein DMG78_03130 [Acidobacteria bacterium]|nr:MAG: hypothetical protein DMG78_03130 [Acidobacteriota bacterium]
MARVVSGIVRDWLVGNEGAAVFAGAGDCAAAGIDFRSINTKSVKANTARTAIILKRIFMSPSWTLRL